MKVDDDSRLTAECARLLAKQDADLRADLLSRVVLPNLARLRGNNPARWNEAGWYSVREESFDDLQAQTFPVPDECGNWYPIEDRSGTPFRFFRENADLDLPVPARPCLLVFDVLHALLPEAIDTLALHASGLPLRHTLVPRPAALTGVECFLHGDVVVRARREGRLRLTLCSATSGIPALLHPGSLDRRCLSLAITYPILRA